MDNYIAEILNDDGTIYDYAMNWQTAQCLAQEGRKVRVIADDGPYMSQEEIQNLCDAELERYKDCFG